MVLAGLLVNPISGMGGSVGLKGTDGADVLEEARRRGACPMAEERMRSALEELPREDWHFLAPSGTMGGDLLKALGFEPEIVLNPGKETGADDTKQACQAFLRRKVDIIIFAGGDGTARDVMDAVGRKVLVIGIPTGVKMHSAVFVANPQKAAELLTKFAKRGIGTHEAEVMDIDEEAFRAGRLSAKLYGYLITPYDPTLVQSIKGEYEGGDIEEEKSEIASFVAEMLGPDVLYILGPGTTVEALATRLKVEKTLLGVDALLNGKIIALDASEAQLLELLDRHPKAMIIITPIGSQGFVFGRGNQQISASVIEKVGIENIAILAAPTKLAGTPMLRVDTGNVSLDEKLRGFWKVVTGYAMSRLVRIT